MSSFGQGAWVIIGWKLGQSCCLEYEVSFDVAYAAQSGGTFLASETLAIPAKNVSNPHEARDQRLTRLCSVFSRQITAFQILMSEMRILMDADNGKILERSPPFETAFHLCGAVMQLKLRSERGLHTASVA
jgi:hypothetical protein